MRSDATPINAEIQGYIYPTNSGGESNCGATVRKKRKLDEVANSHSITTSEMDMTGCVGGGILELCGQNKQLTESLDEQKACIEELERLVQN